MSADDSAGRPDSEPLAHAATALVTDLHRLGWLSARWAGRGPWLDASIALAGMALEHEGHARAVQTWLQTGQVAHGEDEEEWISWGNWWGGAQEPVPADFGASLQQLIGLSANVAGLLAGLEIVAGPVLDGRLRRIHGEQLRQRRALRSIWERMPAGHATDGMGNQVRARSSTHRHLLAATAAADPSAALRRYDRAVDVFFDDLGLAYDGVRADSLG